MVESRVQMRDDIRCDARNEDVNAFVVVLRMLMVEKPGDAITKASAVGTAEVIESFGEAVGGGRIVGGDGDNKLTELIKVKTLKIINGVFGVVVYDIHNCASIESNVILAGKQDFAWINDSSS